MNCVIVDDDEVSSLFLRRYIENCEGLFVKKIYTTADSALGYLNDIGCDILFLDIEMPGMNGIELIGNLRKIPHIVIISSKPDYAAEAFNFDVADYIVKPITSERFLKAINKINRIADNLKVGKNDDSFYVKSDRILVKMLYDEILYVEALADYVTIHTQKKNFTILSTMKYIEKQLPEGQFMRVHRSFMVRLDKISQIQENSVFIKDEVIPVSKSYKKTLVDKMQQL